ncbi:MAG: hypothetical protein AAF709_21010, partial [Pseudomonadota bacterium]
GRKSEAPQKETSAAPAPSAQSAAPMVEPTPVAAPPAAAPPAPAVATTPEPASAPEPAPVAAAPAPVAQAQGPAPVVAPEPAPAPSVAASAPPSIQTPKAALLKQSLSLLTDGSDVEPKVGLDAVAVAPPLVEAAKVVKVQAGGRRVVASFGNSAKVRVYSKRADGTYRLEGAPAQSASRLIVGATA